MSPGLAGYAWAKRDWNTVNAAIAALPVLMTSRRLIMVVPPLLEITFGLGGFTESDTEMALLAQVASCFARAGTALMNQVGALSSSVEHDGLHGYWDGFLEWWSCADLEFAGKAV